MNKEINKTHKKMGGVKLYAVIISICFLLATSAFLVVFFHGNYDNKVLAKLGLQEREISIDWTAKGWENCLSDLAIDSDIVFFGDSITCGGEFNQYFSDLRVVNLGLPGDNLGGMLSRVSMVKAVKPEKLFVMGGINGLTDHNVDVILNQYKRLIIELQNELPECKIFIQSILPVSVNRVKLLSNDTIVEVNTDLKELAVSLGCTYIDLHQYYYLDGVMNPDLTKDGVHLKPQAYEYWVEEIKSYIY